MNENNRQRRSRRRTKAPTISRRMELSRLRRVLVLGVLFCVFFFAMLYRIWYYQAVWGDEYVQQVVTQAARRQMGMVQREIAPARGRILDRNMQPIVSSQQVFTVFLDVIALHDRQLRSRDNPYIIDEVLYAVTFALHMPRHMLDPLFHTEFSAETQRNELVNRTHHHVLAHHVMPEVAIPLAEAFPEVHAREESIRWIHEPTFAPQIIGFIRGDSSWGLESFYNRQLAGEMGRTFWVAGEVEEVPVRDGLTLITTLDGDLQRLAQHYSNRMFEEVQSAHTGVIVMNPHTSEILAMAQGPTFSTADPMNPAYFTDTILRENWDTLSESEQVYEVMRMWRNFHTTRSFEPGSTFKPFVVAAAWEEGLISLNSNFFCEGVRFIVDDMPVSCWSIVGCRGMSLRRALYSSCNLALVDINGMLRRDNFYRYRTYFGFGDRTGIDLPGEFDVSSPLVMYSHANLNAVEMATSSMGQGFNATSIQMINGYAALINGGNLHQPFVVSQIVDPLGNVVHENRPTLIRRVITQETSDFIRREMQHAITAEDGTGRFLAIPGHSIGGKTGTAQQGADREGRTLTFVAYTPVENPQYLVMFIIHDLYETGNQITAGRIISPFMRDFFLDLIRTRGLQPEGDMVIEDWEILVGGGEVMPDFSGQLLRDVVANLNNMSDAGYHVIGSGSVISHHIPAPGQPMPTTNPIFFHMNPASRIDGLMVSVPDVVGLTRDEAQTLMREANLIPIFHGTPTYIPEMEVFPHTTNPLQNDPDIEVPPTPVGFVTAQFPLPAVELEIGTQVMMRLR